MASHGKVKLAEFLGPGHPLSGESISIGVRRPPGWNPPRAATVIDPQDGLHAGMKELKRKLGPTEFLDVLLKAFPAKGEEK